jgi:hypothetical protein
MARLVAFNVIFFLLPFALYAGWLLATRGTAANVDDWQGRTIAYLGLGGAVVLTVALVAFTSFRGAPPGGVYQPAVFEDGRLIPGHID